MADFLLHDLSPNEFQEMVVYLCREILGIGTVNFSEGKDGGRDGVFNGKAQNFPSMSSPWEGKIIIQAKRNNNPSSSCSDIGFKTELNAELEKIKKLKANGEVDYYLIFTTRKLSANTNAELIGYIKNQTQIKDAQILGKEWINLTLKSKPEIAKTLNLNKYSLPLRIFPENIKKVIQAFIKNKEAIQTAKDAPYSYDFEPDIKKKNELNKLSEEYFKLIEERNQSYFNEIKSFLENPVNEEFKNNYFNVVEEINNKLAIRTEEYYKFEEFFEALFDCLYTACPELQEDSRLIYVFLHFMYCNCDIGKKPK